MLLRTFQAKGWLDHGVVRDRVVIAADRGLGKGLVLGTQTINLQHADHDHTIHGFARPGALARTNPDWRPRTSSAGLTEYGHAHGIHGPQSITDRLPHLLR